MKPTRYPFVLLLSLLVALGSAVAASAAERIDAFPARPIRWIVPYPAGGPTDMVARIVGERLAERLQQPVIVENLAGAFGNFIRPDRALAIGLLPRVPLQKVRFVGNAAGGGARMLLANRNLRRVADDVARGVEHVELSQRPDFQMRFAEAMLFPAAP